MLDEAQLATLALQFLQRTDLKGHEVADYAAVHNWLESVRSGAGTAATDANEAGLDEAAEATRSE